MGNLCIPEPGYYLALLKFKSCSSHWLWQKHKQVKKWSWMRLNLIFTVRNIHMETLETLTKSNSTCGSTEFKDVIPSKNDHKHHSNQHENSHKLRNKKRQPLLSLKERQWKLRQQHDQNFLWKKNYCRKNTSVRRNKQI